LYGRMKSAFRSFNPMTPNWRSLRQG